MSKNIKMLLYTDTRLFGVNGWTKMCTTDYSIGPKNNVLERNHIYSSKRKILEEIIKNDYAVCIPLFLRIFAGFCIRRCNFIVFFQVYLFFFKGNSDTESGPGDLTNGARGKEEQICSQFTQTVINV